MLTTLHKHIIYYEYDAYGNKGKEQYFVEHIKSEEYDLTPDDCRYIAKLDAKQTRPNYSIKNFKHTIKQWSKANESI